MSSSIYVVSALCGNLWQESHVNPAMSQQGGGGAFGLFQWDGERRTRLEEWLKVNGYDVYDPNGQMEYLIYENFWIKHYGEFNNLTEFLNSTSTDIHYLTECFCRCWEIAGNPNMNERFRFADLSYDYITQHYAEALTWIIKIEQWLSEAEALNNSVLVYKFYSKNTPIPPEPSKPKDIALFVTFLKRKRGLPWI